MKNIILVVLGLVLGFNTVFAKEATATVRMTAYVEEIATVSTQEITKDRVILSLNSMNDAFGEVTRTIQNSNKIDFDSFALDFTTSEDEIQVITVINS